MSQQNENGFKTFTAGEALEAFRRVKLSSGSGTQVEYADQSDSDGYIGITQEKVSSGDQVNVALKGGPGTRKAVASEALAVGATLYAADDGKVADTASGNAIGTALEAASADGSIIEILEDFGSAAEIDGASTSEEAEDSNGSIPIIFKKTGITDASPYNTGAVAIVTSLPYKVKIINWWIISRDTEEANVKLQDGEASPNDISANVAKGTADDAIVAGGTIVAEQDECAAGSAIKVLASTAAAFDIFVECIRVS
jgi:hypothetical protein